MPDILLDTKYVGNIEGQFYLPDYQRGYRWTTEEIQFLLNDIFESEGKPYCLQPIVVKKNGEKYELIDGQQRLTTIYLIYKYMEAKLAGVVHPLFSLEYETRKKSAEFLEKLDLSQRNDNIDFHFIADAYEYLEIYFREKSKGNPLQMFANLSKLNEYFTSSVSVIWYEVDSAEDGIELFERLNIGKIPLTSSELVKALFLKQSARDQMSGRQEEVSLQWDLIEHELRNPSFWGFLSNEEGSQVATRIDLILDLIAGKTSNNREKYFTFFEFDQRIKKQSEIADDKNPLLTVWSEIYHVFLTLREWHSDHDFYHKIGYLITVGVPLRRIYNLWKTNGPIPMAKDKFTKELDRMIADSIKVENKDDLLSLSYNNRKDSLMKVMTLFNVESERLMDSKKRWFPFDKHKQHIWSLEHIHAQNAEALKKNKDILEWLNSHLAVLKSSENEVFAADEALIEKMEVLVNQLNGDRDPGNVRDRFNEIQQEVVALFTPKEASETGNRYMHEISNMALLDTAKNAALSNSVFDVKRRRVISYDMKGRYIPICTKHVFFKYYTIKNPSLLFWGEADRRDYADALEEKISPYYSILYKEEETENDILTNGDNDTERPAF